MANKNNNSNYNFEILAGALTQNHRAGNARVLTAKLASDYGVSATDYELYANMMTALYDSAVAYEESYYAVPRDQAAIKSAKAALKRAWQDLLKCGNSEGVKLKAEEDDVGKIASYASKFVASEANFDLEEKWTAAKTTANTTPKAFQKSVETLIGIRITETPRLSDDERDYYAGANQAVSRVKTAQRNVDELNKEINRRKAELETVTDEPVRAYIQKIIDGLKAEHEKAKDECEKANAALAKIHDETPEQYVERIEKENESKKNDRRAKRDAKRAEKKAAKEKAKSEKKSEKNTGAKATGEVKASENTAA